MVKSDLSCRNGLIDPKSILKDSKMISIADETIKIGKNTFHDPLRPPHLENRFWAALPHFSTDFIKKSIKMLRDHTASNTGQP